MKYKTLGSAYSIGKRIKKARKKKGYKQPELAQLIGIGYRTLQKYENNEVNPKIDILEKIASTLDCDLEYLLYGKSLEEIKDEEFLYFDSMYKHLEELNEVNLLISNFNHKLDNIENSKLRKEVIKEFTNQIKFIINKIENSLDKINKINKKANDSELEKIRFQIKLKSEQSELLHLELSKVQSEISESLSRYHILLEEIEKSQLG